MSNPSGVSPEPWETPVGSVSDLDQHRTQKSIIEQQERYPLLHAVLQRYFTNGKELDFLAEYDRNPTSVRFSGLDAELKDAIAHHVRVTPMVNDTLGTNISADDMYDTLVDLYDRMNRTGAYAPDALERERKEAEAEKPDASDLLRSYTLMPVRLWGPLRRYIVPIWWVPASGAILLVLGYGLDLIPWPHAVRWIPNPFYAFGLLLLFGGAAMMLALRNANKNPARTREHDKELAEAREEHEAKRKQKKGISGLLRDVL